MKRQIHVLLFFFAAAIYGQDNASLISGSLRADFGPGGTLQAPDGEHFLKLMVDGEYKPLLFDAGLMIGGLNPDGTLEFHDLRGATNTPGIIGNTDPINTYWRVTAEEIEAHQADYADNGIIDNPIAAIFAWPSRGNPHFEEYNGFAIDVYDISLAYFWDQNLDAIYEPEQGDFPVLNLRGCLDQVYAPITEMIFFPIMSTPIGASEPNLQIYLTAFRMGCEEMDNPISNSIFLHYTIIRRPSNNSALTITDTHYGFYADGDIGCPENDYMGTFLDRSATYFYNASAVDNECLSPELSFGDNPPALAIDVFRAGLNHEGVENGISNVMPVFNASSGNYPPATTDYNTPLEAYNYLKGEWKDGSTLLDGGIGYNSGLPTSFAFDGDPTTGEGWSEVSAGNPNGDRKAIISSTPFTYLPGARNEFIIGLTYNDDPTANHLEKINGLRDNIDLIQTLFDGCFQIDEFTSEFLGCSPLTTDLDEINPTPPQLSIYPNPASSILQIELKNSITNGLLQVYQSNGQLMTVKEMNTSIYKLDVTDWPKGIYLLQWKNKDGIATEKLVIQ